MEKLRRLNLEVNRSADQFALESAERLEDAKRAFGSLVVVWTAFLLEDAAKQAFELISRVTGGRKKDSNIKKSIESYKRFKDGMTEIPREWLGELLSKTK